MSLKNFGIFNVNKIWPKIAIKRPMEHTKESIMINWINCLFRGTVHKPTKMKTSLDS